MNGITALWDNPEQTVIRYHFEGAWGWKDLYAVIETAAAMMDTVEHRVCIVLDLRESRSVPTLNPSGLRHLANAPTTNHRNMGIFVIVGANTFTRAMFDIFARLYPRAVEAYHMADSIERAYAIIKEKGPAA